MLHFAHTCAHAPCKEHSNTTDQVRYSRSASWHAHSEGEPRRGLLRITPSRTARRQLRARRARQPTRLLSRRRRSLHKATATRNQDSAAKPCQQGESTQGVEPLRTIQSMGTQQHTAPPWPNEARRKQQLSAAAHTAAPEEIVIYACLLTTTCAGLLLPHLRGASGAGGPPPHHCVPIRV